MFRVIFVIPVFFFLFMSCSKDDVTGLSLSKQDVSLKIGQSDTLVATINYTGDQAKVPVSVTVSDSTITSARILTHQNETNQDSSTFSLAVVFKAKSVGTANAVIHAGSKRITCTTTNTQTSLLLSQSVVENYGLAIETNDNNVFIMNFFPNTFTLDTSTESVAGSGQFVHLESFLSASISSLPAGTYANNYYGNVNTFLPGGYDVVNGQSNPYGTYITTIDNNQVTYTLVKSGLYTVSLKGSTVDIEGDLTIETNEIIHFSYLGPITVIDKTEKPVVVNPQFTKGDLYYVGDYYHMGLSNTFFAYLETDNVDLTSTTLDGELLIVQFDTYNDETSNIPAGNYNVLTQNQFDNYAVKYFTIVPGNFHYYLGKSITGGSWYYNSTSRKRVISGTVDVSNNSGQYVMKYSFYDRIGSLVTGTYKGKLKYTSEVSSAPGQLKSTATKVSTTTGFSSVVEKQATTFGSIREHHFHSIGAK